MKKYLFLAFAMLLGLASCTDAPDFNDQVYVTGTLTTHDVRFLVDGDSKLALTVSASKDVSQDVQVSIAPDPAKLEAYNTANGTTYQLPDESAYSVDSKEVTIQAGKSVSTPLELSCKADGLKDGVSYCLPVTITNVKGDGLSVLEPSKTAYIMFTKVITSKVAQLKGNAWFDIPTFKGENSPVWALNQLTLECKVRPSQLSDAVTESSINPIMGSHESLLLRFGDGSSIPCNKLNFAKVSIGTPYHPDNKPHYETTLDQTFSNDTWYHVAVVYDGSTVRFYLNGELQVSKPTTGGQINLAMSYGGHGWDDTFAIGRSYGSHWTFKGCISEVRLWTIARTGSELKNGMCYVDPTSNGLLAYWRFNGELQDDGTVRDETGHGHNAHPTGNITWLENQKCPF